MSPAPTSCALSLLEALVDEDARPRERRSRTAEPAASQRAGNDSRSGPSLIIRVEKDQDPPVNQLNLPPRVMNALLRHGVQTIGQLVTRTRNELLTEIVGLGVGSVRAIEEALAREDLSLVVESKFSARARPYTRPKDRHIRNHQEWLAPGP